MWSWIYFLCNKYIDSNDITTVLYRLHVVTDFQNLILEKRLHRPSKKVVCTLHAIHDFRSTLTMNPLAQFTYHVTIFYFEVKKMRRVILILTLDLDLTNPSTYRYRVGCRKRIKFFPYAFSFICAGKVQTNFFMGRWISHLWIQNFRDCKFPVQRRKMLENSLEVHFLELFALWSHINNVI